MEKQIGSLRDELAGVRQDAVVAHIAGNKAKAECLTGKAVGMKSILDIAERVHRKDHEAIGELEGIERVIRGLGTIPRC
ncbi:MAG TPA: hypothetical protein VGR78_06655 [Verrucomicrobiae bacterium]|jgi:hypothetical protein|nr:hypothetical protein [Verrucomicrobiae bacterium]